jgi:ATP-dependent helicase/nuclease subunit A
MSTKFTPSLKQKAAIEILGSNVLVSASAGAGKTTVLINRLIKRMEIDKVSVSEIMAVTFTELAAKEMRKRLEKSLNERFNETGNPFLNDQISLLPAAQITTIHGFCLDLLKRYAYVVGFDPERAQNVLDETQKAALMNDAFASVYESTPEEKFDELQRLVFYFNSKPEDTDELKKNVIRLANKLQTIVDQQAWIDRSIEAYDASSFSSMDHQLKHYARLNYIWKIDDLINLAQQTIHEIKTNKAYQSLLGKQTELDKLELFYRQVEDLIGTLEKARTLAKNLDYHNFRELVLNFSEVPLISPPLVSKDNKVNSAVKKLKGDVDSLVGELYDETEWFDDHQELKPLVTSLAEFTQRFLEAYAELKLKHKAIDFDDMEHFALEILRNEFFDVRTDLKSHYKEILVDEFQDTNFVQNEIVDLLSNGHNVFRVGDVKQSIYRFRNAQPEMMQKMKLHNDNQSKVLYLTENYRSTKTIVDFNNLLFDRLMNLDELDSAYTKDDQVEAGRKDATETQSRVEFHFLEPIVGGNPTINLIDPQSIPFIQNAEDDMGEVEDIGEPLEDVAPKAVHIANQIEDMRHNTPFKNYRDYVVLVRSNTIKEQIKAVFEKARIPHHISVKSGFFNSDAVQDVLLMIRYLVDPLDNINFVGLLLSEFVGYSENQLTELKLITDKYQPFSQSLSLYDPQLSARLDKFREDMVQADLSETLRAIYGFNDYYEKYCSIQQRANLDLLSEKAQVYSKQNTARTQFLLLISQVTEEDSSEAIPYTDEDDVVRVMTIHASKGLEFKVVFYWSQDTGTVKDLRELLLIDSQLGFSLKSLKYPKRFTRINPIRMAMEMKTIRDDVQEQVRLLYVALTRAEERLIVVDKVPKRTFTNIHYTNILNALGPTTWMSAALSSHPTFERKMFPSPTELLMHNPPLNVEEELIITPKPKTEVLFKTPSSTHKTFTHFKLNFDQNIGSNHGTLIHELFEKLPHTGVTEEMVKALQPDISQKDVDAVMDFYKNDIYRHCSTGEIKHEFPFYALIGQEVIHGYMDMVALTKDETILIDFKTDKVDDVEILRELYTDQMKDYIRVLQTMVPDKPVNAYLYSLALRSFIEIQ